MQTPRVWPVRRHKEVPGDGGRSHSQENGHPRNKNVEGKYNSSLSQSSRSLLTFTVDWRTDTFRDLADATSGAFFKVIYSSALPFPSLGSREGVTMTRITDDSYHYHPHPFLWRSLFESLARSFVVLFRSLFGWRRSTTDGLALQCGGH